MHMHLILLFEPDSWTFGRHANVKGEATVVQILDHEDINSPYHNITALPPWNSLRSEPFTLGSEGGACCTAPDSTRPSVLAILRDFRTIARPMIGYRREERRSRQRQRYEAIRPSPTFHDVFVR
jgi:hypothetical protein